MTEIITGDSYEILSEFPENSVHLTFTSPPYYNAREYTQYSGYASYLDAMFNIFIGVYDVTQVGRHCVINTSPVLVPRPKDGSGSESSRMPITFDLNTTMEAIGWEFVDDIIWLKPLGAGAGRNRNWKRQGRRPLTWKPELITEYVMVYRKPGKLTRDVLSEYPKEIQEESAMPGDFETSQIWKINPRTDADHPAVFPFELARKVISAYSFIGDTVLDPFCGIGTTVLVANEMKRKGIGIEKNEEYARIASNKVSQQVLL